MPRCKLLLLAGCDRRVNASVWLTEASFEKKYTRTTLRSATHPVTLLTMTGLDDHEQFTVGDLTPARLPTDPYNQLAAMEKHRFLSQNWLRTVAETCTFTLVAWCAAGLSATSDLRSQQNTFLHAV